MRGSEWMENEQTDECMRNETYVGQQRYAFSAVVVLRTLTINITTIRFIINIIYIIIIIVVVIIIFTDIVDGVAGGSGSSLYRHRGISTTTAAAYNNLVLANAQSGCSGWSSCGSCSSSGSRSRSTFCSSSSGCSSSSCSGSKGSSRSGDEGGYVDIFVVTTRVITICFYVVVYYIVFVDVVVDDVVFVVVESGFFENRLELVERKL